MGRLTKEPAMTTTNSGMIIGRYTLAVERRFKRDGEPTADFINCVVFGKSAEFAQKYFAKGTKIAVQGRLNTGSYTNKDGQKVYTTDVIVENQEFAESKASSQANGMATQPKASNTTEGNDGFMNIPDGVEENLPFI